MAMATMGYMFEYWLPVGGTDCEGLGGMILLEEVCHWVQVLRFQMTCASAVCPFCLFLPIKMRALSCS